MENHYNYHRYYDPAVGRYTQVDPLATWLHGADPYGYAKNDPLSRVDPLGLRWIWKGRDDQECRYERKPDKSCPCGQMRKVKVCWFWECSGWMWEQEGFDALRWENLCFGGKWWGLGGPAPRKPGTWRWNRTEEEVLGCVSKDENLNPTWIWQDPAVALGR